MKHNYLLFSYNYLMKKYKKYFSRLQRHLNKGTFSSLSPARKNFLVRKVEELRTRLQELQPKLTGTIAATLLLSTLNLTPAEAQPFVFNSQKDPFAAGGKFPTTFQSQHYWSTTAVGDLDNDGDRDILISDYKTFYYYQNTGTPSAPSFSLQTGTNNPMSSYTAPYGYPDIVLSDMDGDNDLDLIAGGNKAGTGQIITYYQNTGTVSSPVFTQLTGTNNPFPACSGYTSYGSPAVADIDGDGDKDVFLADGKYGSVFFFQNTGNATNPVFTENSSANPFPTGNVTPSGTNYATGYLNPTFADIDGDGDLDALMGQKYGEMLWYKNTGTATAAVMTLLTGTNNPLSVFNKEWEIPTFADMNNDGTLDLVLGEVNETNIYYNYGTTTAPLFSIPTNFQENSRIRFADIDGDSDQDAIFSGNNTVTYVVNNGPATAPVFTSVTGTDNPFNNISSHLSNAFADLDGDLDLDLVIGYSNGNFYYYQNTGTATAPVYTQQVGTNSPLDGLTNGKSASTVVLVDIDNDGDQDLVSGVNDGSVVYFQNTGTTTAPSFTQQTGTNNPFGGITSGNYNYPTFVNFDGDGDFDLLIGTRSDGLFYYQNTGTASTPVFTQQTGTNNPFDFINTNYSITYMNYGAAFMDADADGDLDLFVAQQDGTVKLYENRAVVATSVFVPKSSSFSGAVSAYPNPVKDVLNFSLSDGIGSTLKVDVLDMTGIEVMNESTVNNGTIMSINVSSLNTGVYTLRLSSDSKIAVVKFVKQ